MEFVVPSSAPSLAPGSLSGPLAWAGSAGVAAAPDTDCATELSLAGGAAAVAPCAASVGSAGGPQGVGVLSASATEAVRDCPASPRPFATPSCDAVSPSEQVSQSDSFAQRASGAALVLTRQGAALAGSPQGLTATAADHPLRLAGVAAARLADVPAAFAVSAPHPAVAAATTNYPSSIAPTAGATP